MHLQSKKPIDKIHNILDDTEEKVNEENIV